MMREENNFYEAKCGWKNILKDKELDDYFKAQYGWLDNLTDEELDDYYEAQYGWLDNLTNEELDDYYNQEEEERDVLLKGSSVKQKVVHIDAKSPLHPDNPYYQKLVVKWDWIGIIGFLPSSSYLQLTNYLDGFSDLKYSGSSLNRTYNIAANHNRGAKYSNFRVKINRNNITGDYYINLHFSSKEINDNKYRDRFKYIRSLLIPDSIKIKRLDLSFITLLDLSNVYIHLSHAKTRSVIKSNKKESEKTTLIESIDSTETIALNVYKSKTRVNLYNKKVQLSEKKKIDIDIEYLYNLEFTFNQSSDHGWEITYWRDILDRFTLNKDILAYYEPKEKKSTKLSPKDFYYALLYLYVNDKPLFKQKYPDKMHTMKRQYDNTVKELTDAGIEVNLVPKLKEALKNSEARLVEQVYELTGCKI